MLLDITTQGSTGFTGSDTSACNGYFQRYAHACHRHHHAGVTGCHHRDLPSGTRPRVVSTAFTAPDGARLIAVTRSSG
jgi:hypothetical protein